MSEQDFSESINDSAAFRFEREVPGQHPAAQAATPQEKLGVKYGRFVVRNTGCPELEEIMADCLSGKKILAQEKWYFTKEGDAVVIVKYFTRDDTKSAKSDMNVIHGRRRLKKAMAGEAA